MLAIRQCAAWVSTLITQNIPEIRNPRKQRKPIPVCTRSIYLICLLPSMIYLRYSIWCICSLLHLNLYSLRSILNPFRPADPFWGQTTQFSSSLSPKRDCGSKRVNPKPHSSSIPTPSMWVCHPPPCFFSFPVDPYAGVWISTPSSRWPPV